MLSLSKKDSDMMRFANRIDSLQQTVMTEN
jgi:hypothetical protein